jgi:LacI family transcriptional regulator
LTTATSYFIIRSIQSDSNATASTSPFVNLVRSIIFNGSIYMANMASVTTKHEQHRQHSKERVTLVEVARDAGVSRATASLVLRGSDLVADETRARVLAAMHKLGYVYHRGAASLRAHNSQTIGLIVPDITNPFFAEMTVSIEARLDQAQHVALLGNTAEMLGKQERLLAMMQEYRADGVLLCPVADTSTEAIARLRQRRLPFVLFARYIEGADADYVGADNLRGAQLATEHLLALGHQRIAFVGGPAHSSARSDRVQGYCKALVRRGLPINPALQLTSPTTRAGGHQAIRTLLELSDPPTAVLCYNDIVAFGVLLGLQQSGHVPGRDVAVVGFDDIAEAALSQPALTTVAISPRQIGEQAARLLLERVAAPDAAAQQVILQPKLIVRESCLYVLTG